jgi:hypothetical protein
VAIGGGRGGHHPGRRESPEWSGERRRGHAEGPASVAVELATSFSRLWLPGGARRSGSACSEEARSPSECVRPTAMSLLSFLKSEPRARLESDACGASV